MNNLSASQARDFSQLENLLATNNWKQADHETFKKIVEVAGRKYQGWLRQSDIEQLRYKELQTIDRLWLHYSNNQFGFSVQKQIYQQVAGKLKYDPIAYKEFGKLVGWCENDKWLYHSYLNFDQNAPKGHLPAKIFSEILQVDWASDFVVVGTVGVISDVLMGIFSDLDSQE
jgi:hypothetical protein